VKIMENVTTMKEQSRHELSTFFTFMIDEAGLGEEINEDLLSGVTKVLTELKERDI